MNHSPTGTPISPLAARMRGGAATLRRECSWNGGRVYAAIKNWRGADAELHHERRHHTLVLTLTGGTTLTGTRISGSRVYEGRDTSGCVTFIPSGAERVAWYRNASLDFMVLLIDPDLIRLDLQKAAVRDPQPFTNRRDPLLESVLWSISREMQHESVDLPSMYVEHAAGLLLSHVTRSTSRARHGRASIGGLSERDVRRLLEFIEDNLHRNVSLSELGALVGMGADVLARNFKARMGLPPYRYVTQQRMRRAQALLAQKEQSISEIALAVGFSSQSHFTTHFSRLLNTTPATYRALRHG